MDPTMKEPGMTVADFIFTREGFSRNKNRFQLKPRNHSSVYLINRIVQLEKENGKLSDTHESFNAHLRSSSRAFNDLMEEKKELTAGLNRMRRACSCLTDSNAMIRSCAYPEKLLQDLCNTLNQWGFPFAMALGITGPDKLRVMASAGAGYSPTEMDLSSMPWDEVHMIRQAWSSEKSSQAMCIHRPFVSFTDNDLCQLPLPVLAIPLTSRDSIRGFILIYEQSGESFSEDDIPLLSEIGRSIPAPLLDFILS